MATVFFPVPFPLCSDARPSMCHHQTTIKLGVVLPHLITWLNVQWKMFIIDLWSLAGWDLEVKLKKHSLIQTKPPISTLPKWASSANTCEVAWWHIMFVCIGWWLVKVRHTEPLETEWHFMIARSYNSPLSNWTRLDLAFILCYSSGHTFLTVETWVPHHWRLLPIIGVNHVSQSDCPAISDDVISSTVMEKKVKVHLKFKSHPFMIRRSSLWLLKRKM